MKLPQEKTPTEERYASDNTALPLNSHLHYTGVMAVIPSVQLTKNTGRAAEQLSGLIERITFHSKESGFCVLRVRVRGHRDQPTVVGTLSQKYTFLRLSEVSDMWAVSAAPAIQMAKHGG